MALRAEKGDIGDGGRLRQVIGKHKIEAVAHLASMLQFGCEMEPARAVEVNVMGTMAVLEAAREAGVKRVVIAGTLATYGGTSEPIDETSPIQADAPLYGVTKLLCEKVARRYNALYGMDCRCLRYAAVLSPRRVSSPGVAAALATIFDAASGQDVLVKGVAAGERRHYAHTSDIALGTRSRSWRRASSTISSTSPAAKTATPAFRRRRFGPPLCAARGTHRLRGQVRRPRADGQSRARNELGYRPSFTLEGAVQAIVQSRLAAA